MGFRLLKNLKFHQNDRWKNVGYFLSLGNRNFWRARNITANSTANILQSYCDEEYKKLGLICSILWEHFLRRRHRRKKHSRLQWWHCGRQISSSQANFSTSSLLILNCRENSYFCIFTQNCNNVVS